MVATEMMPEVRVHEIAVRLTAVIVPEPEAGGYPASVPALRGCHTQGETLEEVEANLREAVDGWLAVVHDSGIARAAEPVR